MAHKASLLAKSNENNSNSAIKWSLQISLLARLQNKTDKTVYFALIEERDSYQNTIRAILMWKIEWLEHTSTPQKKNICS